LKEKILKNKKIIDYLILIIIGFILCIPLMNSSLDVYHDDGIQHISRAFGTLSSIKQNGFFPNVIIEFADNFGYSWNLFYGPLTTYGIIIINFISNNFIIAYKIFAFISLILSGIFMYKFINAYTKNNNVALLASILYMTFPYHLTDLYTRNAIAEYASFMFVPLVFYGLYNLFYTSNKHYYLAIRSNRFDINTQYINNACCFFCTIIFRDKF